MQFLDIALAENILVCSIFNYIEALTERRKNTAQICVYSHRNSPVLTDDMYMWSPLGIGDCLTDRLPQYDCQVNSRFFLDQFI